MDRLVAALLAGAVLGFVIYSGVVLVTLMSQVVPIWIFGVLAGVMFVLSIAYDVVTTSPQAPRERE